MWVNTIIVNIPGQVNADQYEYEILYLHSIGLFYDDASKFSNA